MKINPNTDQHTVMPKETTLPHRDRSSTRSDNNQKNPFFALRCVVVGCGVLLSLLTSSVFAEDTVDGDGDDNPVELSIASQRDETVLNKFLNHVENLDLTDDLREDIRQTVSENDISVADAVTEALIQIYAPYADAVEFSDNDELGKSIQSLTPLTQSEDKFLAADATFFLARTFMNHERYEDAIVHLRKLTGVTGQFSAHQGPAQYFLGLAQAGLLEKENAFSSFIKFLKENPNAPERMRVSAWRQAQTINKIEDGKLGDIHRRMEYSRRRLEQQKTDQSTQTQQTQIVKMLNKLIKEAEKKEASSSASNTNKPQDKKPQPDQQAKNKPSAPKPNPSNGQNKNGGQPNGTAVVKNYDNSPASPWSRLRDRSRDPANNAVKDKLPARYRDIVERYMEAANGQKEE